MTEECSTVDSSTKSLGCEITRPMSDQAVCRSFRLDNDILEL